MHAISSTMNNICASEALWPTDGSQSNRAFFQLTARSSHNAVPVCTRATDMEEVRRGFEVVKQDEAQRNDFFEVGHRWVLVPLANAISLSCRKLSAWSSRTKLSSVT